MSCKVGPEHALSPHCWESTLTTGLSPLESLESHTQSCSDTWCHSCHAAAGRIPHLPAADRSRTCPLGCSAHALETEPLTLKAIWWNPRDRHPSELRETLVKSFTSPGKPPSRRHAHGLRDKGNGNDPPLFHFCFALRPSAQRLHRRPLAPTFDTSCACDLRTACKST